MNLTIGYPYAGFVLEIEVDACEGREQTMIDPPEPAEFCITAIELNGTDAMELIGFSEWGSSSQFDFERKVEEYYIEMERVER
jgi:hypothetical protein